MKNYIIILLTSISLLSCKTQNAANAPLSTNAPVAESSAFFKEINKKPSFQQIKINSRVNVETGNFIPTLDATI